MKIIAIDKSRNSNSIAKFAEELGVPVAVLLEQFIRAGVSKTNAAETVTSVEKAKFLDYLREVNPQKIAIKRRTPGSAQKNEEKRIIEPRKIRVVVCKDPASVNPKSFLVVISFDLMNAESKTYSKIKEALKQKGLTKTAIRSNGKIEPLPSNLFSWKFQSSEFKNSSEVNDYVATELRRIFTNLAVKGRFFISVGQNWSWNIHSF